MTIDSNNNNFNYLIDPTFTKGNRLFILSFEKNDEGDRRDSFWHYYIQNVEIKYLSLLIDRRSLFLLVSKIMKKKLTRKVIEMSRNNDYTSGHLLDFAYFKENYRLLAIDLSKQT